MNWLILCKKKLEKQNNYPILSLAAICWSWTWKQTRLWFIINYNTSLKKTFMKLNDTYYIYSMFIPNRPVRLQHSMVYLLWAIGSYFFNFLRTWLKAETTFVYVNITPVFQTLHVYWYKPLITGQNICRYIF